MNREGGRYDAQDIYEDAPREEEGNGCFGVMVGCGIMLVVAAVIALAWILTGA